MRDLHVKIDKTVIPQLPRYAFEGRIVVVQSEDEANRAVRALRAAPMIGMDTETRPAFKRGEMHKVALLQMATEDICFLFRLNQMGLPEALVELLSDKDVLKLGLSLHDDFTMLCRRNSQVKPAGYIDLQDYVKGMGIEDLSLQKLYANVFGRRISKSARLSNWEADVLTEAQKVYAATDAVTCIQLYKELKTLKENGDYRLV
ncbi:MAG: 3'-5' exonuclease domain-containing protein 2 [Bacteroidales bacterium]|nr:3'-5' exonuclease domain-containing protein 2 [Bacteroidales bacterium]